MLLNVKIYPPTSKAMLDQENTNQLCGEHGSNARIMTELYSDFMQFLVGSKQKGMGKINDPVVKKNHFDISKGI